MNLLILYYFSNLLNKLFCTEMSKIKNFKKPTNEDIKNERVHKFTNI